MLKFGDAHRNELATGAVSIARGWLIETTAHASGFGLTFRFTDFDRHISPMEHDGVRRVYDAEGQAWGGPTRLQSGFREHQGELTVQLGTGSTPITSDMVERGILDGAIVTELWFNPLRPWMEPRAVRRWHIADAKATDVSVTFDLVGISGEFKRQVGIDLGPVCRNDFGNTFCDWAAAISSHPEWMWLDFEVGLLPGGNTRRTIRIREGLDTFPADGKSMASWWGRGLIEWTSGVLQGVTAVIESNEDPFFYGAGPWWLMDIELATPVHKAPTQGDTCRLRVGCDGLWSTCGVKFGNRNNFRGWQDMPGSDAIVQTPGAS